MRSNPDISLRKVALHGTIGAALGFAIISVAFALDVFNVGSLAQQTRHSNVFLLVTLFKPMLWFGTAAIAWSVWQQANPDFSARRSRSRQSPETQATQ